MTSDSSPPAYTKTSNDAVEQTSPSENQRRSSHPSQPLPPYVKDRGDDEQYLSALRAWVEEKKYITPGTEGTFDMGSGSAWLTGKAMREDEAKKVVERTEGHGNHDEGKRSDSGVGALRRLSGVFHGRKKSEEEK